MLSKTLQINGSYCKNSPIVSILRLRHKLNKENEEKLVPKLAADVINYLESNPEYQGLKDQLPRSLLRKYKTPESMYLIDKKTAKEIAKTVKKHLDNAPVVEVNPGLGFLSEQLLQVHKGLHFLYETSNFFTPYLNNLQHQYPSRVKYKVADFFGMWKPAFQDKMDQGNRIKELLGDLYSDDNDRIVKVVGAMAGLSFLKHLIANIVFHNATNHLGRPDLYIVLPGHHFEFLTDSRVQLSKHKTMPALFQLLFDHRVLGTVPRAHFLPWIQPSVVSKHHNIIDDHCYYLVNITQKKKLPCPPEFLPLLWYFFKPRNLSKSTRVIPMLEQWIPGCGVWLITGQDPPDTRQETSPGADDAPLPHMTIFTEFGDLNLKQKLTVFKKFISWPEFEQCQFRVSMENSLPKSVAPPVDVDDKDSIPHVDDIESSDSESDV